ncbi:MAG: PilZ domain-containing protein [Spirochaetaceae bacterium]|nr:PilZ domain-containing protein [Spirochaetaceae bacterium]
MEGERRRQPRFKVIAKVKADELCIFPGTLLDVSSTGCKIRFPISVTVDMEKEYQLKIKICQNKITKELFLIGQPVYSSVEETSEIGFVFLRSPDSRQLDSYIQSFQSDAEAAANWNTQASYVYVG